VGKQNFEGHLSEMEFFAKNQEKNGAEREGSMTLTGALRKKFHLLRKKKKRSYQLFPIAFGLGGRSTGGEAAGPSYGQKKKKLLEASGNYFPGGLKRGTIRMHCGAFIMVLEWMGIIKYLQKIKIKGYRCGEGHIFLE